MGYTIVRDPAPAAHQNGYLDIDSKHLLLRPPVYPSNEVKDLCGGTWDKVAKVWRLQPFKVYYKSALELFPGIYTSEKVEEYFNHYWSTAPDEILPAHLFPFQQAAIRFLQSDHRPGKLLCLSPGLGKTACTLLASHGLKKVLFVAPKSLLRNWEDESETWHLPIPTRCWGTGPTADRVITNYETLQRHLSSYIGVKWDLVVLDESILIKNRDTLRFKIQKQLRPHTQRLWELSGSPVSKYADDLWAQLHIANPKGFSSYWRFTNRYCYVEQGDWGVNILGSRRDRDLQDDLSDVMFVRHQKDVLPDLPDFIPMTIRVDLNKDQLKAHEQMLKEFVIQLETGEEMEARNVMSQLIRLQQVTSNLKNLGEDWPDSSAKAETVEDLLVSGEVETPLVVWSHWVPGAESLYQRLKNNKALEHLHIECVNGKRTKTNEANLVAFKHGQIDVLILSMPIGKFGHTFTKTKTIIYCDKSWAADDFIQSLHRVQRIGLEHRPVLITLKAFGTVDEVVEENLAGKMPSISQVSNADLATLLRGLGR